MKAQRWNSSVRWLLCFSIGFLSGCATGRQYSTEVSDRLIARAESVQNIQHEAVYEVLIHAEAVLICWEGRFSTIYGEAALRRIQKRFPNQWFEDRKVQVLRMEAQSDKNAQVERERLRKTIRTMLGA